MQLITVPVFECEVCYKFFKEPFKHIYCKKCGVELCPWCVHVQNGDNEICEKCDFPL